MKNWLYLLILLFGAATYISAVVQMLLKQYVPSFFSRGVWFLLGINSFAGVFYGGGSRSSVVLATTLFFGNAAVFAASYKYGSREFGSTEKISLALLVLSSFLWITLDAPYLGLVISLVAHFIGGIPTIARVARKPHTEQAYHWYFFFIASILTVINSNTLAPRSVLFPIYFAVFDGIIIALANRKRIVRLFES